MSWRQPIPPLHGAEDEEARERLIELAGDLAEQQEAEDRAREKWPAAHMFELEQANRRRAARQEHAARAALRPYTGNVLAVYPMDKDAA